MPNAAAYAIFYDLHLCKYIITTCIFTMYYKMFYLQEKESWNMTSEEKLEQSEIVKNKGTKYFKVINYLKF